MTHVLVRAEAVGSAVLWLGVWERNQRALAFYRKWRFDVVGEHTFKVGDDPQRDLLMCRDMSSTKSARETGMATRGSGGI
jgi:ribosomal protein S18 acetylase RimI-like enzyme